MRDDKQDKERENPNFDDLIKELNSLLDKIPQIIESDNIEIKSSLSDSNLNTNKPISENVEQNIAEKKEESLNIDSSIKTNEEPIIIKDGKEEGILIENTENKDNVMMDNIIKEDEIIDNISLETIDEEAIKLNQDTDFKVDLDINLSVEEQKLEKQEKIIEIDNISSSDLDLSLDKEIGIDTTNISNEVNETINISIGSDEISFEQPIETITKNDSFTYSGVSTELERIIYKKRPDNISEERIRRIAIIYASNDDKNLKSFLDFLDEISLFSKEKPMFVERSIFMLYDENFSLETFMLTAQNEKINGVVLIGNLPVDKIYELESSISQLGCVFLNLKGEVSKSIVIDFILDLIAV